MKGYSNGSPIRHCVNPFKVSDISNLSEETTSNISNIIAFKQSCINRQLQIIYNA